MKIVIFGLTVSSSWGNGHATLWRGLIKALARRGHSVTFFERNTDFYAENRDLSTLNGARLTLYDSFAEALPGARRELQAADVAITTSYCPDAIEAARLVQECARPLSVFYDLDTPVTLALARGGQAVPWLGPAGLGDFDLVLSFTGGRALDELKALGARRVVPLYGHADPDAHSRVAEDPRFKADLSWLGTWASDRQNGLEALFAAPARARPHHRFLLGGSLYPQNFPWTANIWFVRHIPPQLHSAFYSSSRLTLNVTRDTMARMGWCPSGRLFEAAACQAPVVSDWFEGLDAFFEPGREILIAHSTEEALSALDEPDSALARIAQAAHERLLRDHTSARRADELMAALEAPRTGRFDHPPVRPGPEPPSCGV
jgi:spore maturation protein CgeB